jgi:hypothetical protein
MDERVHRIWEFKRARARGFTSLISDYADCRCLSSIQGVVEFDITQEDFIGQCDRSGAGRTFDIGQCRLQLRWTFLPETYPVSWPD